MQFGTKDKCESPSHYRCHHVLTFALKYLAVYVGEAIWAFLFGIFGITSMNLTIPFAHSCHLKHQPRPLLHWRRSTTLIKLLFCILIVYLLSAIKPS